MYSSEFSCGRIAILAVLAFGLVVSATRATAQQFSVVYSFGSPIRRGAYPNGGVVIDKDGVLYGTTSSGGASHRGEVYKLTPTATGNWDENVLYSFGSIDDGAFPIGNLTLGASGNIYGVTQGGVKLCSDYHGVIDYCGTVFELSHQSDGSWQERTIHVFNADGGGRDGWAPIGGLVQDAAGNLYGTTYYGGPRFPSPGYGTVFELMPDDKGGWTEKIIYAFGSSIDGGYPEGGLILDAAGNLYGTTVAGGTGSFSGNGTAFELTPIANGHWKQSVLHNFSSKGKEDGYWPASGLVMDATGNLYGTTQWGGTYDYGTVFELTPVGDGRWTETILHNFKLDGFDGLFPSLGALSFDSVGNLYGATSGLWGTVYQLTPAADGTWAERILHTFANAGDGWYPYADLAVDRSGNIYGTTNSQHNSGSYGNVFEITP